MRLSLILSKLRQELSDPSGTNEDWDDAELSGILSDQVNIMVRRQVKLDEAYHNHKFDLLKATAVQRSNDVWAYKIPSWLSRIVEVRRMQDSDSGTRKTVFRRVDRSGGAGWRHSGLHEIELARFTEAEDITILCAKRPARLTQGTIPAQTSVETTELRMDVDGAAGNATDYPHEPFTDGYANAIIEMTGVATDSHIVTNQIRTVISSAHNQVLSTVLYTELTLDSAWTEVPVLNDTYEMHPEILDEHLRLLVLLSARCAWGRKGNADEVRASEMELFQEWREFESHVQPRDLQEPKIIKGTMYDHVSSTGRRDQDTYYGW